MGVNSDYFVTCQFDFEPLHGLKISIYLSYLSDEHLFSFIPKIIWRPKTFSIFQIISLDSIISCICSCVGAFSHDWISSFSMLSNWMLYGADRKIVQSLTCLRNVFLFVVFSGDKKHETRLQNSHFKSLFSSILFFKLHVNNSDWRHLYLLTLIINMWNIVLLFSND